MGAKIINRRQLNGAVYDRGEYEKAVDELRDVAAGRRGWSSITAAARKSGVPKNHLRLVAEALGLEVEESHGRHGMTAHRRR